jgi:phospholipase C
MLSPEERARAEAGEREMARAPEATMRRREFLSRSAYTAGLVGAATSLPLNLILGEAAKQEARAAGLPSPSSMPIDHFVVLMMENRSFDHYFGWLPNADAVQNRTYLDPQNANAPVSTRHASTLGGAEWQGCGHPDPDHSWDGGRSQLGSSLTNPSAEPDGFLEGGNDEFALCYYDEGDLGFIHAAGKEFTVFDRFHCSLMASTWPNRYYNWSAQAGGRRDNTPPVDTGGNQWETLFDRALKSNPANLPGVSGLTARYYNSDLPFSAVWGPRGVSWTRPVAEYYADCAAGTLPNITFVDPPFRDGALTTRDAQANNIGLSMNWSSPNLDRPALPDPERIVSKPCTLGGGDVVDAGAAHTSDLAALEDLAARFGFPTGTATPDQIFREPDSVQKALA